MCGYIFLPKREITTMSNYIPEENLRKQTVRSLLYGTSKTQRQFATRSLRLTVWYNLYLIAYMNAMKSRSVSSLMGRVLKSTALPSIHKTARRVGGHSAHCGRNCHSLGICVGIVLRMRASFCVVNCQIWGPSSHSKRRCCIVSCMPQLLHYTYQ